jgi:hypothetical protein
MMAYLKWDTALRGVFLVDGFRRNLKLGGIGKFTKSIFHLGKNRECGSLDLNFYQCTTYNLDYLSINF